MTRTLKQQKAYTSELRASLAHAERTLEAMQREADQDLTERIVRAINEAPWAAGGLQQVVQQAIRWVRESEEVEP